MSRLPSPASSQRVLALQAGILASLMLAAPRADGAEKLEVERVEAATPALQNAARAFSTAARQKLEAEDRRALLLRRSDELRNLDEKLDRLPVEQAVSDDSVAEQASEARPKAADTASENKSGVSPQALALPSGEGSVDGLGESFETQLNTGTATFSLPIQVPPARGQVQPSLAFSYSSGGGQGVAGMGWSVGVPSIARQTDKGVPRYDGTDRFMFGGEELVEISGWPNAPASVSGARHFRLKLEGRHWRFFYLPDTGPNAGTPGERGTWLAQDKDGTTYHFGTSLASRVENDEGVFRWSCSEVVDIHGNRAVYEYFRDLRWVEAPYPHYEGNGQSYLIAALYNEAADGSFKDRVGFGYEGRTDILTSYASGYAVRTVRRLASVTVDTEYQEGQARRRVRSYALDYDPDSYHSLLTSIQLVGNDGITSYPPITFGYTEVQGRKPDGTTDDAIAIGLFGELDASVHEMSVSPDRSVNEAIDDLLDVDADGLPDLFVTDQARNLGKHAWVKNVDGTRFDIQFPGYPGYTADLYSYVTGEQFIDDGGSLSLSNRNVQLLDIDGNGHADLLHMPRTSSYNYYVLDLTTQPASWKLCDATGCGSGAGSIPIQGQIDLRQSAPDIRLFDVNNDHLIDVVQTTNGATKTWLNLGGLVDAAGQSGWGRFGSGNLTASGSFDASPIETCPLYKGLFIRFSDPEIQLGDMNGDGLQDVVHLQRGNIDYWPGRGYGSFGVGPRYCGPSEVGSNRHLPMGNSPYFSDLNLVAMKIADVNGDNLADLVEVLADSVRIWLNEGGHAYSEALLVERTPPFAAFSNRLRSADMNGSGSRDLVWGDAGNYRYIDFTGGIEPRLLVRIDNGLGKLTDIAWESTTEHRTRLDAECEAGDCRPGREGQAQWTSQIPFPTQVVAEVTVSDQMDLVGLPRGEYATEYRYYDPYYDGHEHEFRGFAYATARQIGDTNSPTSESRSWFYQGRPSDNLDLHQDEALKGMVFRSEALDPEGGVVLSTTVNQITVQELEAELPPDASPAGPWVDRATPASARIVRQAYVSNSYTFLYDSAQFDATPEIHQLAMRRTLALDGSSTSSAAEGIELPGTPEATTRASTLLDEYGRELETLAFGRVSPGFPGFYSGDERFSFTEWAHNDETWVHRPTRTTTTGWNVSETFQDTYFCYDYNAPCGGGDLDVGDVTKEEAWVRDPIHGDRLITRTENDYDAFGHVVRAITGGRQERTFDYGGPTDRFFVYVAGEHVVASPQVTLSAYARWEPGFGQISRFEDYNFADDARAVTTVSYDALGRVHTIHQPHVFGLPPVGETTQTCLDRPTVQIGYVLADLGAGRPVSSATVFRRELECADDLLVSVSYVDGLGRVRESLAEGSNAGEWVLSGYVAYDGKGGVRDSYQPFFVSGLADAGAVPAPWPDLYVPDGTEAPFTTTNYDAFERTTTVTHEDGSFLTTTYHALSDDQCDEDDTDPASPHFETCKTLRRNGLGRLAAVIERNRTPPEAGVVTTTWSYRYDAIDDLVQVIDPAGNVKDQTFDSLGRKVQLDDPNAGIWTFAYDPADNLRTRIDGRGARVEYAYDGAGRMLAEEYFQADSTPYPGMEGGVQYFYDLPRCQAGDAACLAQVGAQQDLKGRLSYVLDLTGATHFSYGARGRVTSRNREIEGSYFTTRMEYDALDRETRLTYPDSTDVSYTYDDRGLLTAIPGYVQQISYTAAGLREQVLYDDAALTQRDSVYDVRLRPETLVVQQASGPLAELIDEEYVLDGAGNFREIIDHRTAAIGGSIEPATRSMTYDALYQLLSVTLSTDVAASNPRSYTASFAYDEVANLTKRVVTPDGAPGRFFDQMPGDYAYGNVCPFPQRPYAVCFVHDTAYSGGNAPGFAWFDYDDAGNMTEAQIHRPATGDVIELYLTWDALGRLVTARRVENGTPKEVSFAYDYAGVRVIKRVLRTDGTPDGARCGQGSNSIDPSFFENTTLYVDATTEVRGCKLTKFVFASGRRIARVVTETPGAVPYLFDSFAPYTFFYHPDHLGSTSTVTDDSGAVVNHSTYYPYGKVEQEHSDAAFESFSSDYKYTDKELDEEIGLVYFGARYYWPELGRWVSGDPFFLQMPAKGLASPRQLGLWSFSRNNPIAFTDPNGMQAGPPIDPAMMSQAFDDALNRIAGWYHRVACGFYGAASDTVIGAAYQVTHVEEVLATSLSIMMHPLATREAVLGRIVDFYGRLGDGDPEAAGEALFLVWSAAMTSALGSALAADAEGGVWGLPPRERGILIENDLAATEYVDWYHIGAEEGGFFPLVDFQRGNILVSLKSADTRGLTWLARLQEHIDDLAARGATVNGRPADLVLDLRVQSGGAADAASLTTHNPGVTVRITEYP